jgi:carboxylesterase type B
LDADIVNWGKAMVGAPNTTFEEDCLYLNVWAKPQTGEKKKAVMIWIYGGAYSLGASSAPYYSAARYAAEHDVVAVSLK